MYITVSKLSVLYTRIKYGDSRATYMTAVRHRGYSVWIETWLVARHKIDGIARVYEADVAEGCWLRRRGISGFSRRRRRLGLLPLVAGDVVVVAGDIYKKRGVVYDDWQGCGLWHKGTASWSSSSSVVIKPLRSTSRSCAYLLRLVQVLATYALPLVAICKC